MNRLQFKSLKYRNILSTGQMMTEVRLDRSPSTMVTGKNGGGKSTVLDALYFALFGKPFRKINKPQLINTKNGRDMLVELEFSHDKDEYVIRRGQKPDVFEVLKNGEKQNIQGDSRAFQTQFENTVLRMNYDVAAQIMAIGKAQHVSFMRLDSAKRRLFVESILGLLIFGKMSQLHAMKMTQHKEKLIELKAAVGSAGDKVKVRTRYIADLKKSIADAEKQAADVSQSRLTQLNESVEAYNKQMADLQAQRIDPIDMGAIHRKLNELRNLQTKFDMKIESMKHQREHLLTHDKCETCNQLIPIETRSMKSSDLETEISKCQAAWDSVSDSIEATQARLEESNKLMAEDTERRNSIQQIAFMIDQANKEIVGLKQDKLEVAANLQAQVIAETENLEKLVEAHTRLRDKYEYSLGTTEYMNLVTNMLKDSGIKAVLIKKYLPIINHSINVNLANLGFFAKFSLDETFNETIQARGIDTLSYNNFSEGEKLRIDMAILMAWRDIARLHGGVSSNLLFFDEIFDSSMDAAGTDSLMLLLNQMKDTNLFIITHTPEKIADKVRSHIQFGRVDGFSKMLDPRA